MGMKKWDEPIAKASSTIQCKFRLFDYTWDCWRPLSFVPSAVPSYGQFIAELLDSKVMIIDAGNGSLVCEVTLMELALQRIRAAGLGSKPGAQDEKSGASEQTSGTSAASELMK